jgi:hypothetical protein
MSQPAAAAALILLLLLHTASFCALLQLLCWHWHCYFCASLLLLHCFTPAAAGAGAAAAAVHQVAPHRKAPPYTLPQEAGLPMGKGSFSLFIGV